LDIGLDFERINVRQARFAKTLADKEFRSRHMIGSHRCICCTWGNLYEITLFVADTLPLAIASAHAPHVANVMTKKRNYKVEPVARADAALLSMLTAQNLLAHKRYHYGVVHIVVGGIAVGDVLQSEAAHESNDVRIGRLQDAVALGVRLSKLLDKRLDNNLCGIKHGCLPELVDVIPVRACRHGSAHLA